MTQVSLAPLVYARTAFLDFRPNFLAAPALDGELIAKARTLVQGALQGAERLDDGPRWVMFALGRDIAAGVIARAPWFSDELTHELQAKGEGVEERGRLLHAFVGAVIRSASPVTPERTQAFYRTIYEHTVAPRWRETRTQSGWEAATMSAFRDHELPAIPAGVTPLAAEAGSVQLHPVAAEEEERLWVAAAAGGGRVSLCLRAASAYQAKRSGFDVATARDVVASRTEARAASTGAAAPASSERTRSRDRSFDTAGWDEEQKKKNSAPQNSGGFPVWIVAAGALAAIVAAILLLRGR